MKYVLWVWNPSGWRPREPMTYYQAMVEKESLEKYGFKVRLLLEDAEAPENEI